MRANTLIKLLESRYPAAKAESWDNTGFQAGRADKEVKKVFLALDATDEVIRQAVDAQADMLITHHPLMMSGVKKVTSETLMGRKIIALLQNDICHYAMHTNYDVVEMGPAAGAMLKLKRPAVLEVTWVDPDTMREEGIGMTGELLRPVTVEECAEIVKTVFKLDSVKIFGDRDRIVERVAISPGSGKSMIPAALRANAEVLITGDIGHHEGIDAVDQDLVIIDAGHYGIEHIFIERMRDLMKEQFPELEVVTAKIRAPFSVI